MSLRYRPLITLDFRHAFFSDGIFRGVTLQPVAATARKMSNYRLLAKGNSSGFRLLQECRNDDPVIAVEQPFDLAFGFRSNDPDFQARTDVEFFSSNKEKLVIDLRDLLPDESPSVRLLPVAFSAFKFSADAPTSGTLIITNSAGKQIAAQPFSEQATVVVDLSEEPEDVYTAKVNDTLYKEFVLLHQDSAYEGIVFLRAGSEIVHKTISFSSRSIYWQYTILQKYGSYTNLSLVEETESVLFEKAAHPSIDNALYFVSLAPVKLSETYSFRLHVEDSGRVLRKKIPFADLKNVGRCLINVHNYCLQNYLTV